MKKFLSLDKTDVVLLAVLYSQVFLMIINYDQIYNFMGKFVQ